MNKSTAKAILAILVVAGIAAPYYFLFTYVAAHGLDIPAMCAQIVSTKLSIFGWVDVVVSAIVLLFFMLAVKRVRAGQMVAVTLATCLVGVSAGLPLYLYFLVDSDAIN